VNGSVTLALEAWRLDTGYLENVKLDPFAFKGARVKPSGIELGEVTLIEIQSRVHLLFSLSLEYDQCSNLP
jgi:hypothetical protein